MRCWEDLACFNIVQNVCELVDCTMNLVICVIHVLHKSFVIYADQTQLLLCLPVALCLFPIAIV